MQPIKHLDHLDHNELLQTSRQLLAEASALSSRISALNEIGLAVNQSLDLERIERVIAKQAKWLLDFDHCSVCLEEDDVWCIKTLFGPAEPEQIDLNTMPNLKSVFNTTRPRMIGQLGESAFLSQYPSQIIIPLTAENEFLGTINFASRTPDHYTHDDLRIAYMLSLQLSSAIRNAHVVAELKATREELKMRVEELDAYAHTIAHDLKSPLANILLRSQLVSMKFSDAMPEKALEMVKAIEHSTVLMNRMIEQLLLLARLRDEDIQPEPVNIREAVDNALHRFEHQIEEKGIALEIGALPDACGYEQWVEEIFANLISNAIKYMGSDNAAPRISICGEVDGKYVRYCVQDTGIGIKQENVEKLFTMFSRVHDTPVSKAWAWGCPSCIAS